MLKIFVSALLIAASAPAFAVHKCEGADGRITYQDLVCPFVKDEVQRSKDSWGDSLPTKSIVLKIKTRTSESRSSSTTKPS